METTSRNKTRMTVFGILSIVIGAFALMQSMAFAGLMSIASDETSSGQGVLGFIAAALFLTGGIMMLAQRSKTHHHISIWVVMGIGVLLALLAGTGAFSDMLIYAVVMLGFTLGALLGSGAKKVATATQATTATQPAQPQKDNYQTLLEWKKLLDDGVITQDEYNQKKKELL